MSEAEDPKSDATESATATESPETAKEPKAGTARRGNRSGTKKAAASGKPAPKSTPKATRRGSQSTPATPHRRGGRIGLLLLFLLLVAVAGGAGYGGWWLHLEQQTLQQSVAALEGRDRAIERGLEARLDERDEALSTTLDQREQALDAEQEAMARRIEALAERLGRTDSDWYLVEVAHLLRLAEHRMELADDPRGARIALEAADRRLADRGEPNHQPVRDAIATARQRLDATDWPDIAGLSARLNALAGLVDALPLREPGDGGTPLGTPDEMTTAEGWRALLAESMASLRELVIIRRHDQAVEALLPPEQASLLRLNLNLRLDAAQAALLRGDEALFHQQLERSRDWIAHYFDPDATATASALDTIGQLLDTPLHVDNPDLTAPREALRAVREGGDA